MLIVTGEVRKVVNDVYQDRRGNVVNQAVIVFEPEHERQNHEVFLSKAHVKAGLVDVWLKKKGHQASVAVSLFISHEYKLSKLNALTGKPLKPFKE